MNDWFLNHYKKKIIEIKRRLLLKVISWMIEVEPTKEELYQIFNEIEQNADPTIFMRTYMMKH